jgi:hypothetical protein
MWVRVKALTTEEKADIATACERVIREVFKPRCLPEECTVENRFNVMWHRHTGQWWRLHGDVSLAEALRLIATDELLGPL